MSYNSKYTGAEIDAAVGNVAEKQDKNLYFTDVSASDWVESSEYPDYPYQCDMVCAGVTSEYFPDVVLGATEAASGNYSSVCESLENAVRIYSRVNTAIVVPTIKISK